MLVIGKFDEVDVIYIDVNVIFRVWLFLLVNVIMIIISKCFIG